MKKIIPILIAILICFGVGCPWRSANNINQTDMPEPVPFAGIYNAVGAMIIIQ